jgi:hypothetical protein
MERRHHGLDQLPNVFFVVCQQHTQFLRFDSGLLVVAFLFLVRTIIAGKLRSCNSRYAEKLKARTSMQR